MSRPSPSASIGLERRTGSQSDSSGQGIQQPTAPLCRTIRLPARPRGHVRYDHIWTTGHFDVTNVEYMLDGAVAVGSDHAVVVTELDWRGGG